MQDSAPSFQERDDAAPAVVFSSLKGPAFAPLRRDGSRAVSQSLSQLRRPACFLSGVDSATGFAPNSRLMAAPPVQSLLRSAGSVPRLLSPGLTKLSQKLPLQLQQLLCSDSLQTKTLNIPSSLHSYCSFN